jgi:hypothetical protein
MVALVVTPVASGAAEVWRWHDAEGRLHYSNLARNVPPDAEAVRTRLGRAAGTIRGEDAAKVRQDLDRYRDLRRARLERDKETTRYPAGSVGAVLLAECCAPFGLQHLLTTTGRSLADQVQEAALLDALNVRWRTPTCP